MENFKKSVFRTSNGITLIALVVTIIIILILAGISISMVFGDKGLITQSVISKEAHEKAEIIETAKLDILDKQAENSGSLSEDDLIEVLTSPDYSTQGTLSDGDEYILAKTLTSKDEKYSIPVSAIYDGELTASSVAPFPGGGLIMSGVSISVKSGSISFTPKENQTWYAWATDTTDTSDLNIGDYSSDPNLTLKQLIKSIHEGSSSSKIIKTAYSTGSGYVVNNVLSTIMGGRYVSTTDIIQNGSYTFSSIM